MTECLCFDETYSTTRLLIQEKPALMHNHDDAFETVLFLPENKERRGEGGLRTKGCFKKSYEGKPLLSVVTVVYNGEKYLEQTIQSVINQSYDNVEYIIIDGGSTDGTLDIIKKYEHAIDYWVSEPDKGIYDAMNKGIMLCVGEMVGLINADDYYEGDIFLHIATTYDQYDCDVLYGDTYYIVDTKRDLLPAHHVGRRYGVFPYSYCWIWVDMLFGHPSTFVKRQVYKQYGLYDTKYEISADYEFFLRLYRHRVNFYYLQKSVANFRDGGISTTRITTKRDENFQIRKDNNRYIAYLVLLLSGIIQLKKRLKS